MIDKCWIKAEWKGGDTNRCNTSTAQQDWRENMVILGMLARALVETAVTEYGADRERVVDRMYSEINLAMAEKTENILLESVAMTLPVEEKP